MPLAATQTFTLRCTHMRTCARGETACVRARVHARMHRGAAGERVRYFPRSRKKKNDESRFHRAKPDSDLFRRDESLSLAYILILPKPPAVVVGQDEDRIQMGTPEKCFSFFKAMLLKHE